MRDERSVLRAGLCGTAALGLAGAAGTATATAGAGATTQERVGDRGDEDAGATVYRQHCVMCHGDDATGMMGMHPALTGAVDRLTEEGVEVTIRNGRDSRRTRRP